MFDLRINPPSTWRVASIPKKDGSKRHLLIPNDELKALQRNILDELQKNKAINISPCAVGFVKYKNTVTGAMRHDKDSPVIIQMDIKDFFPSFPIEEIRRALLRSVGQLNTDYIMKHSVFRGKKRSQVPQGAPTSPFLTNVGMFDVDCKIAGLAKRLGYTYSRYADDMCFAMRICDLDLNDDPGGWKKRTYEQRIENRKAIIKLVSMILNKYLKLKISWKKLQVSFKNSPRVPRRVTGVTIRKDGKGYNAPKKIRREARGLTHVLWKKIQEGENPKGLKAEYRRLIGLISYCDYVRSHSEEGYNGADPVVPVNKYLDIRKVFGDE